MAGVNKEIAKIFYEMADYLATKDDGFRVFAYRKAGDVLASLEENVEEVYKKGGLDALKEIPGIGESLAKKIEEYIKTQKIKSFEKAKKQLPINLEEIIRVEGLGPRKARILYQKLDIKNVKELEKAAKSGKIRGLEGFGEKTERNILEGIEFLKRDKGRFLLGEIMPTVEEIYGNLKKLEEVKKISVAGSVRRMKETIGDVDILVSIDESKKPARIPLKAGSVAGRVMDYFTSLPGIEKIWAKGATKSSIRLKQGFDVDLRVVPEKSFGSALQYFTGSKEHNIMTRRIAIEKGLKLNEYGLFKGGSASWRMIAGKTEEEVYKALGLPWIPPEIREDQGEIQAGLENKLPDLIGYSDIKGDLHCHSNWDGGENSIEEMADYAIKLGYEYIGISDHTKFLRIENGLNEEQLLKQREEIKRINAKIQSANWRTNAKSNPKSKFQILHGCETNILPDGSVDIKDEVLAQLDYVIAGVHSSMKMERKEMTARIIKAMENPNIDIISHPTGRIIQKRDEYLIDFNELLKVAKKTGTILEINSYPARLDLKDTNIKKTKEFGVRMIMNTDAHEKTQMNYIKYGISQARRGWAEKEDIINTGSLAKILKFFNKT